MRRQWSLGAKLTLLGAPFLLLVLLSTAATLWVSWQLDGGAAAVNEAGRMRMQAYRMALSIGLGQTPLLREQIGEFDANLALLRSGDPERPLFVPWDEGVRRQFAVVAGDWALNRARWLADPAPAGGELLAQTGAFVAGIDALVIGIESHIGALDDGALSAADLGAGDDLAGRRDPHLVRPHLRPRTGRPAQAGDLALHAARRRRRFCRRRRARRDARRPAHHARARAAPRRRTRHQLAVWRRQHGRPHPAAARQDAKPRRRHDGDAPPGVQP